VADGHRLDLHGRRLGLHGKVLAERTGEPGAAVLHALPPAVQVLDLGSDPLLQDVPHQVGGHALAHAALDQLLLQAGRRRAAGRRRRARREARGSWRRLRPGPRTSATRAPAWAIATTPTAGTIPCPTSTAPPPPSRGHVVRLGGVRLSAARAHGLPRWWLSRLQRHAARPDREHLPVETVYLTCRGRGRLGSGPGPWSSDVTTTSAWSPPSGAGIVRPRLRGGPGGPRAGLSGGGSGRRSRPVARGAGPAGASSRGPPGRCTAPRGAARTRFASFTSPATGSRSRRASGRGASGPWPTSSAGGGTRRGDPPALPRKRERPRAHRPARSAAESQEDRRIGAASTRVFR